MMRTPVHDLYWQPLPLFADRHLHRWLIDRGSLTARIQARCDEFRVHVLSQRLARPESDEYRVIGVRADRHCLVREITLNCGNTPVVFAHSIVDPRALNGPWLMLADLGSRPLGAVLFADHCVRRFALRFCKLGAHHALYRRASTLLDDPPAVLWARRSLFVRKRSRLLVTEVFLPAIQALHDR